ncbi:MAG: cation diffusion facilitator family transporter [Betaproteobacteria bacterium]
MNETASAVRFAWLSIGASIVIIALKGFAYWLTGSVALLSDAIESLVNLAAACVALVALRLAARPADEEHPYGRGKAEYFSSGFEGGMILVAALAIIATAIERLLHARGLEHVGIGIGVSLVATVVNFAVARILFAAGRRHDSIALEADARHLLTDVWTTVGVVVGVGVAAWTGWPWLDPAIAIAVAVNIVWVGWRLMQRSAVGLMDAALPAIELDAIRAVLDRYRAQGIDYHALRTRRAAARRFIEFHVLVPGAWTVQQGHALVERIEGEIRERLARTTIVVHLEPLEDPASWQDTALDRDDPPNGE